MDVNLVMDVANTELTSCGALDPRPDGPRVHPVHREHDDDELVHSVRGHHGGPRGARSSRPRRRRGVPNVRRQADTSRPVHIGPALRSFSSGTRTLCRSPPALRPQGPPCAQAARSPAWTGPRTSEGLERVLRAAAGPPTELLTIAATGAARTTRRSSPTGTRTTPAPTTGPTRSVDGRGDESQRRGRRRRPDGRANGKHHGTFFSPRARETTPPRRRPRHRPGHWPVGPVQDLVDRTVIELVASGPV
jgi:hypothetical protein